MLLCVCVGGGVLSGICLEVLREISVRIACLRAKI
jgi:hypothetical protein